MVAGRDRDQPLVHGWRVTQLTRLGTPGLLAEGAASHVDWHEDQAYSCVPMASMGGVRSPLMIGRMVPVMPRTMVPPITASQPPAGM